MHIQRNGILSRILCIVLLAAVLVLSVLLVLSRRGAEAAKKYAPPGDNLRPLIRWNYQADSLPAGNLSQTAQPDQHGWAVGKLLIRSWAEYEDFLQRLEQNAMEAEKDMSGHQPNVIYERRTRSYNSEQEEPLPNSGEIDEAFFTHWALAVIDLESDTKDVYFQLNRGGEEENTLSLTIYLDEYPESDGFGGAPPARFGTLYWIPVSQDCQEIHLHFVRARWYDHADGYQIVLPEDVS